MKWASADAATDTFEIDSRWPSPARAGAGTRGSEPATPGGASAAAAVCIEGNDWGRPPDVELAGACRLQSPAPARHSDPAIVSATYPRRYLSGSTPAEWRDWWVAMEVCAHRAGAFDAVRWTVSPDLGPRVLGRWQARHAIYVVPFVLRVNLKEAVEHEMLHDLLGTDVPYGAPHPPEFARCGV